MKTDEEFEFSLDKLQGLTVVTAYIFEGENTEDSAPCLNKVYS